MENWTAADHRAHPSWPGDRLAVARATPAEAGDRGPSGRLGSVRCRRLLVGAWSAEASRRESVLRYRFPAGFNLLFDPAL